MLSSRRVTAASLVIALALTAAAPASRPRLPPIPNNAQCRALPRLPGRRLPLRTGERLDYTVDFLGGIEAGTVTLTTLAPRRHGDDMILPVSAHAVSSKLFSRFGRFDSRAVSWLRPRDLHPSRYREDFVADDGKYWTELVFPARGPHVVRARWGNPKTGGQKAFPYASDALDVVGAFYLLRSLDLRTGQRLCFDAYGGRTFWRVWGQVDGRETVVTPAGRFATLRLSGTAARLNAPSVRRAVHFWISDDPRRLPVAAMGELDFGPMRAVLSGIGEAPREEKRRARDGWME